MENIFKERFRTLRKERGLTQLDLAEKIGVDRGTIIAWENGGKDPRGIEMLVNISSALTVSVDYLIGLTDIQSPSTTIRAICEYTGLSEKSIEYLSLAVSMGANFKSNKTNLDIRSELKTINLLIENLSGVTNTNHVHSDKSVLEAISDFLYHENVPPNSVIGIGHPQVDDNGEIIGFAPGYCNKGYYITESGLKNYYLLSVNEALNDLYECIERDGANNDEKI